MPFFLGPLFGYNEPRTEARSISLERTEINNSICRTPLNSVVVLSDLLLEAQLEPMLYECQSSSENFLVPLTDSGLDVSTIKASSNDLLGTELTSLAIQPF